MRAALYLRLSSEDDDLDQTGKGESESISNQRNLLRDFVRDRSDLAGYQITEFCDDGWSGKNFDRPGFQAMMEEVRAGRIQCIVVKDLSRFGRDYLEVGNYLSRVFPQLGVRLIAVNDSFDSIRSQDIDSLDTSFKTLIYDLYSRELSQKVKSAKRQRAERGLYVGAFAPYGYRKDPEDKNHLLIDPEAAAVVGQIFTWAAEGVKSGEIAARLNRAGVPTPMVYKRAAGCSRENWGNIRTENLWMPKSILKMLHDERYLGKSIYGKRESDQIGRSHKVKRDRSEWVVVEGTHAGIVSEDLFQRVQGGMKPCRAVPPSASPKNPLRRKVICGICGYTMALSTTKNAKYHCRTHRLGVDLGCPARGIPQADIHALAAAMIRRYAACAVDQERLAAIQREQFQREKGKARRELSALESRRERLEGDLRELYEKLVENALDHQDYLTQRGVLHRQMEDLARQKTALETALEQRAGEGSSALEQYRAYTEMETLTPEAAQDLVERVTVYPDDRIEIKLVLEENFLAAP